MKMLLIVICLAADCALAHLSPGYATSVRLPEEVSSLCRQSYQL